MNLLLIVVDALRADRTSSYGYHRRTSPFIDALARQGALFENFFAPIVPTHPAVTTMFTGQFPLRHQIIAQDGHHVLHKHSPWFPEILLRRGYTTAAVDSLADERDWFARGFQTYLNPRKHPRDYPDCSCINNLAVGWLRSKPTCPFFLFVHYYDPHTPYMPPPSYRHLFYSGDPTTTNNGTLDLFYHRPLKNWFLDRWLDPMAAEWPGAQGKRIVDIEFVRAQYDASIRLVDDGISQLIDEMQSLGLYEDITILIAGDHGQELGEHGIFFDQHGLYESNIHPPLIICWPGSPQRGRRIPNLVQMPDLAPTILEMAGCAIPETMEGHSLVALLTHAVAEHVYDEVISAECTWMAKWALRRDGYKLIIARDSDFYGKPPRELYDLSTDPGEQINLAGSCTERCNAMARHLEEALQKQLASLGRTTDPLVTHGITMGRQMFKRKRLGERITHMLREAGILSS